MDARFRILGPIEIDLRDGRLARVPRGRVLSLLALLLVRRGAAITIDRLVDELWQGLGPQHPRNAVQVLASRLRGALDDDLMVLEGGGYALHLPAGALDAERFEEAARRGREALRRGEPWDAAATLRQAVALWRGPALADVSDQGFAQPEIARLEELRLSCLSDRIAADLACGRHADVVGELDALVSEHPLRERLRAQQMLALYRVGRQAEALEAYRDAHRALGDGLGIEPSPDLRALEAAILRQEVPDLAQAQRPAARDARRWVTCVFSQVAEADDRSDPESMRAVLEQFHARTREVCRRHEGTVAELRSDSVVAVFGLTKAHEDDAHRALRAASELIDPAARAPLGGGARAGVCTGEVVAAAAGGHANGVIGEAVKTAERLARSAGRGEIRLAESTWQLVRHAAHAVEQPEGGYALREIAAQASAINRRPEQPLIGRDDERQTLRRTFERVVHERSAELLTVLGEPGIGKSRLVAEFASIVGIGGTVLTGRCPPYGEGITFWPLREAVLQAKGERSTDELAAALAVPAVAVRRVAAAVGLQDGEAGEDTAWAFMQLFGAIARSRPLVLVVDDAHWAEPALLDLLLDLLSRFRDAPVLVAWVGRADELGRSPARGVTLALRPLSTATSESLLVALTADTLEPRDARRIVDAAGGNPLFLEQLVSYVGERHSTDALPPALHALLATRLDGLPEGERSAVDLAAVVGDQFEPRAVHALAADNACAAVEEAWDRLIQRGFLVADRGELRFRHPLIRDVAYSSLAKAARARLHEHHAGWLAGLGSGLPEADARIGFHLETACRLAAEVSGRAPPGLAADAGLRLATAARAAHRRGDPPGEVGFLDRAVTMLGRDGPEAAALLPDLASALLEAGKSERAEAVAGRAVRVGASLRDARLHARATIERERIRLSGQPMTFRAEASMAVVAKAVGTLREVGDELGLARAAFLLCDLRWLMGDPVAAHGHAQEMLVLAHRTGSDFEAATALMFISWCLIEGPWPVPVAIARCDALAEDANGLPRAQLTLLGCRAVLAAMMGRYDEGRADMARARAGLGELGPSLMAFYMALLEAVAESFAGHPVAAERAAREAAAMVPSSDRWHQAMVNVDLAHAVIAQGRDATAALERIDRVPAPCDAEWVVKRHAARAWVAARTGEIAVGVEEARAAVAAADATGLVLVRADAHSMLADVLRLAGDHQAAVAAAGRARALHESKGALATAGR